MWCQRVGFRHGGREDWMHVTSSTRDAFRSPWMAPHLTHGLCPECLAAHYPDALMPDARECADLPMTGDAMYAARRPRRSLDRRA